jgi:hypothetical protein
MDQQPSVGRRVHYASYGSPVRADGTQAYTSQCRAAVITAVYDENNPPPDSECATGADGAAWVGLAVLNPTGMFFHECVCQDDRDHSGGTWHWPERV